MSELSQGVPPAIKPCPFCGMTPEYNGPAWFRFVDGHKWGAVQCCCTGPEVRTQYKDWTHWRDAAIAEWNERA